VAVAPGRATLESAGPRVALAHDYLNQDGGAERVLLALHRLFPAVYTSIFAPERLPAAYRALDVRTSFMQRLPGVTRRHQAYLLGYPFAFARFDLRGYDVIVSSSSAWAKGVSPPPGVPHVCYCHAPMRFAWSYRDYIEGERVPALARLLLPPLMAALRRWDIAASAGVTRFVANSRAVAGRIGRFYGREAVVIHPPVETGRFSVAPDHDGYFLIVQRLVPYKRLDLVIEAFNRLRLPLKVVGDGRARADLERLAGPTIEFTGRLPEAEWLRAFERCRAYIVPGEEDFAIAPVEAQAAGRPVIALGRGGVLDTVVPGRTGLFFHEQTPEALAAAVRQFEAMTFNAGEISAHASTFDTAVFERKMRAQVAEVLERPTDRAAGR
jgi:glycosyltransferase involved in cell wall biosynthesis